MDEPLYTHADLLEIAAELGMAEVAHLDTLELIQAILERQRAVLADLGLPVELLS